MAKVFLETGDDYRVVNDNTTVYGVAGDETDSVIIESDATDVTVNANVDRVDFAGSIADFTFQTVFGANLLVYAADGTTLIASIPLQEDADGTQLVFSDGAIDAIYDGTVTAGGIEITDTAAAITPDAADIDETTTTEADVEPVITNPQLSVSTADVAEGETATFTVTLDEAQTEAVTVDYTISYEGDASADDIDLADLTGTLTFAAGETTATVEVPVVEDAVSPEEGEGITLTLDNATGADTEIDVDAATANITDVPLTFTLTQGVDEVQEGDSITYTLTASAPLAEETSVFFSVVPGDASVTDQGTNETNLNDFSQGSFNPYEIIMNAGDTTATFILDTENDGLTELPEDFSVIAEVDSEQVADIETTLLDGPQGGESFVLTLGTDVLTGTSSDDTFIGQINEYIDNYGDNSTFDIYGADIIDGGDGYDTLKVTQRYEDDDVYVLDVINVEHLEYQTFDEDEWYMNGMPDIEKISIVKSDDTGNDFYNVQNTVDVAFSQNIGDADIWVEVRDSAAEADSEVTVTVEDNAGSDVDVMFENVTGDDFVTVYNVEANGDNENVDLDLDDATETITVNLTGDSSEFDLEVEDTDVLATIDASGFDGDLTLDAMTATVDLTVTTGAGDDTMNFTNAAGAADDVAMLSIDAGDGDNDVTLISAASLQELAVTTGDGDDDVAVNASNASADGSTADIITGGGADEVGYTSDANVALTLDLGDGDDTLTIDNAYAAVVDTRDADMIDGGAGVDSLRGLDDNLAAIAADADKLATISNFETLVFADAVDGGTDYTLSDFGTDVNNVVFEVAALTAATFTVKSGGTVRFDQEAAVVADVTSGGVIIDVVGASEAGSSDDVVNLELNADFDEGGADVFTADVSVDYVETLNITSTGTDETGDDDGIIEGGVSYYVNVEDGDRLSTINVDASVETEVAEDTTNFTALNEFNASESTAGVTVDVTNATQGVVMTGGEGDDDFTGSIYADEIATGDGDDTITGGTGGDQLSGGAGDNTFVHADGDSSEAGIDVISGFQATNDASDNDTLDIDVTIITADVVSGSGVDVTGADADLEATDLDAIVTDGIITLEGADTAAIDTLAEWIDVAETVLTDTAATADTAAFEFDSSTYVVISDVADATGGVIQLAGVTGIEALDTTAAADTILLA